MGVLLGLDAEEIRALLGPGHPAYRARQIYEAVYRQGVTELAEVSTLPLALRRELAAVYCVGMPALEREYRSGDGTRRYLLRLEDGRTVESVVMPEATRTTLCISTQVGCPVGCLFCMTAKMGWERNLTAGEIAGQVLWLARIHGLAPGERRLNVVLMGQGEPLLNLDNVQKATRLLSDPEGFGLSLRRITLSTVGLPEKILELGRAEVRPRLAVSLHATRDEDRARLVPAARKYTLKDLIEACRRYPLRSWERLSFEYVLLNDVNDSEADARRLVKLLSHLKAKVNLIPLNPGPEIPFQPPAPERVLAFQQIVRRAMPCLLRKPRGQEIFAACGQLRRMEAAAEQSA